MRSRPRRPWWSLACVLKWGVSSLMRAVSSATCTSGLPVSLAARALSLTTSALTEAAIIEIFLLVPECLTCGWALELSPPCALRTAKPRDYTAAGQHPGLAPIGRPARPAAGEPPPPAGPGPWRRSTSEASPHLPGRRRRPEPGPVRPPGPAV